MSLVWCLLQLLHLHLHLLHLLPRLVLLLVKSSQLVIFPLQLPCNVTNPLLNIPLGLPQVLVHQGRANQLENLCKYCAKLMLILCKYQVNIWKIS